MELINHKDLYNSLTEFAIEYANNPYKCIYEADAQVMISTFLERSFPQEHKIHRAIEWRSLKESNILDFNIGKVHREYPTPTRFDNVVLGNPKQHKELKEKEYINYEAFYHQPVKYAIEIKLVQLYLSTVAGADKSISDYERLIQKVEDKLFNKDELEFALQLTLFQSIKDQEKFLDNHQSEIRNPKWQSYFNELKEKIKNNSNRIGYYYVDLKDKSIKEVINMHQ